ncbi:MAG: hypothetical protein JWO76_2180, partial [Nocardioides sp.]|nr:hypothetical protein [Nocardioides sp.]
MNSHDPAPSSVTPGGSTPTPVTPVAPSRRALLTGGAALAAAGYVAQP